MANERAENLVNMLDAYVGDGGYHLNVGAGYHCYHHPAHLPRWAGTSARAALTAKIKENPCRKNNVQLKNSVPLWAARP